MKLYHSDRVYSNTKKKSIIINNLLFYFIDILQNNLVHKHELYVPGQRDHRRNTQLHFLRPSSHDSCSRFPPRFIFLMLVFICPTVNLAWASHQVSKYHHMLLLPAKNCCFTNTCSEWLINILTTCVFNWNSFVSTRLIFVADFFHDFIFLIGFLDVQLSALEGHAIKSAKHSARLEQPISVTFWYIENSRTSQ